jgi:hypothetical protein
LQLILYAVPGAREVAGGIGFSKYGGPALIIIDNREENPGDLTSIAHDGDVVKIETINSGRAAFFGSNGVNGAILIYMKEGLHPKKETIFHSIVLGINGYQDPRFFYSPKYDTTSNSTDIPDVRNTLYWNPYIQPDENGNAEISYYNSEANTNVNVTLEGITSNGIPIVVKTNYSIKK